MGENRREVDTVERRAVVAVAGELGVEHRLHQRTQEQAIVGGDEVQGRSHRHDAHDLAVDEEPAELVRIEPFEPRPQADIGVERHLGLHPDEVLDRRHARADRNGGATTAARAWRD